MLGERAEKQVEARTLAHGTELLLERMQGLAWLRRHDPIWIGTACGLMIYALVMLLVEDWNLFALSSGNRGASLALFMTFNVLMLVLGISWHLALPVAGRGARLVRSVVLALVPGTVGILAVLGAWSAALIHTRVEAAHWVFTAATASLIALAGLWYGRGATASNTAQATWRDWLTLTKPGLNALVLMTCLIGFWLAGLGEPFAWGACLATLLGTWLVASAASVFNQYGESGVDRLMPRTAKRPLPSEHIIPAAALRFGVLLGLLGLAILTTQVNMLTAYLGALSFAVYIFVYTPLKRINSLSTLAGAICGAIPPLMGWTAATGTVSRMGLLLFFILFLWQIPHFLAIAWKYREQYRKAGFAMYCKDDPSGRATGLQCVLYAAMLLPVAVLPVVVGQLGWLYGVGALLLGCVYLWFSLVFARERVTLKARNLFLASIAYHPLLFALMVIDRLILN